MLMQIYFFHQAPRELQAMSTHGGDEDFVILIPVVGTTVVVWDSYKNTHTTHVIDDDDCNRARYDVVEQLSRHGSIQNAGFWKDPHTGVNHQVWITAHA